MASISMRNTHHLQSTGSEASIAMKKSTIISSLLVISGIILGMIPPIVYHLLVTPHLPLPVSLWDSRPCRAAPGPLTCDGILPHAPRDLQAITRSSIPGDGMCIDRHSQQWSMHILDTEKGHHNQPFRNPHLVVVAPLSERFCGHDIHRRE